MLYILKKPVMLQIIISICQVVACNALTAGCRTCKSGVALFICTVSIKFALFEGWWVPSALKFTLILQIWWSSHVQIDVSCHYTQEVLPIVSFVVVYPVEDWASLGGFVTVNYESWLNMLLSACACPKLCSLGTAVENVFKYFRMLYQGKGCMIRQGVSNFCRLAFGWFI